jgi:hypothetical protein
VCGADRPDGGLAAIHPDAHVEPVDAPRSANVGCVHMDELEDPQRRARSALRIVRVRSGNAEVSADSVALVRLDRATELLHRAAHARHDLADERLDLVDRETLTERGRADDVGEENRDRAELVVHEVHPRLASDRSPTHRRN